jgi:hypothetical protein
MSTGHCESCKELIEAAALSIKNHLEATAALALAVQNNMPEEVLSTMSRRLQNSSLDRENAVEMYKRHVAGHSAKVMTAGLGSADSY